MTEQAIRNRSQGRVTGLRPEHCNTVRYASWPDIKPVLDLLNRPKRGRWMGNYCALCAGWHSAMVEGQAAPESTQQHAITEGA